MNTRTSFWLSVPGIVGSALFLAGCGGSTKPAALAPSTPSHTVTSSVTSSPSQTPALTPIAPGPTFTDAALHKALLSVADMGKPYELSPREGLQATYPWGCETLEWSSVRPPLHPTGGRPSQAISYVADLVQPTKNNNYSSRAKIVFEQYVLFPDAKSAAAEQQALEATVTPACLQSHHVPATADNDGYTLNSTEGPFTHGAYTGMVIHDTSVTDSPATTQTEDNLVEARDGSLLVLMWFNYQTSPQVSYNFQDDANGAFSKALDKLATTGQ